MRLHIGLALGFLLVTGSLTPAQEKAALPDGALARLGVHRLRVQGQIFDSAFTPDGRTLVVVFHEVVTVPSLQPKPEKPNVVLFDVATGLERKRLDIRSARHVAMARDKPLMVLDSTKGFELWDVAAEKFIRRWKYPELAYNADVLAISP